MVADGMAIWNLSPWSSPVPWACSMAGMLESTTVELLRETGLGTRLDAEGLEHDGIYVQFDGERHHLNFRELTGCRWVRTAHRHRPA